MRLFSQDSKKLKSDPGMSDVDVGVGGGGGFRQYRTESNTYASFSQVSKNLKAIVSGGFGVVVGMLG